MSRTRRRRFIGVALVLVTLGAPTRALAQEAPAPTSVLDEYTQLLEEETELRDAQKAAELKAIDLADQVAALDADIVAVEAELAAAQADLAAKVAAVAEADAHLIVITDQLAFERTRLQDQSIQAYIGGGATPVPNFSAAFGDAASINNLATGRVYATVVVDDRKQAVARYAQAQADFDMQRAKVDAIRQEAETARDDVAAHAADLDAQRSSRVEAQAQSEVAAVESARLAEEIEARRRDAELRYAAEVFSSDSIQSILAARQKEQIPAESTFEIFLNPIKNGRLVSSYGMRMHPILGYERMHNGIDIDGHMGDLMRASEAGVVVVASEQGGYGNTVVIDHGNTLSTLYGHMSQLDVKPGDVVERGQVVGLVGSTGRSTGPHCHWEVRVLGVPVDGFPYLDPTVEP